MLPRYGCVILKGMAANATHTQEDMVVLSLWDMAVNVTHTQAIWLCYPDGYGCECHTYS